MFRSTNCKCLKFTHATLEGKGRTKTHIFCSGLIFFLFLWNVSPLPHPFTLVFFTQMKYCRIWPGALRQLLRDGIIFINRWHNFSSQSAKRRLKRGEGTEATLFMPSQYSTNLVHRSLTVHFLFWVYLYIFFRRGSTWMRLLIVAVSIQGGC